MSGPPLDAVVVGAGLAGLSAAYRLKQRGLSEVVVLDAAQRAGGCVQSLVRDGRLFETGPNSLRGRCPAIRSLMGPLGLESERLKASSAASERWLWLPRGLTLAPSGPAALLASPALSVRAKARLFAEPLRRAWRVPMGETSIAAFLADRLGAEAFETFGAPLTTGIFAGDPEGIGVEAFAPLAIAAGAGGLARGMGAIRAASTGSELWTLRGGLSRLAEALAASLELRLGVEVTGWTGEGDTFAVQLREGEPLLTRRLVLAVPSGPLGQLLQEPALDALPAVSVATVSLAFSEADFETRPTGFGMLVSRQSPLPPVLGLVFASRVFEGRAPSGELIVTAICGGSRHPEAVTLSDEALIGGAVSALREAFGLRGAPLDAFVSRWTGAIPQVPPGHVQSMRRLRDCLPPRMSLAGSALGGVSLEQVVASGLGAADRVSAA